MRFFGEDAFELEAGDFLGGASIASSAPFSDEFAPLAALSAGGGASEAATLPELATELPLELWFCPEVADSVLVRRIFGDIGPDRPVSAAHLESR
mmetsp:Transcript_57963/g.137991  ORF Transcript_57963/g.137991 Transcript_57963/m.137991 type:complete len:95 (-) Transcript_57963:214-498(-)